MLPTKSAERAGPRPLIPGLAPAAASTAAALSRQDDDRLRHASDALDHWIEAEGFAGWDPYDALNSPLLRALTFGSRRLGQVWVQLLKRSPLNLRSLLRISKGYNPKGMGLFLASY